MINPRLWACCLCILVPLTATPAWGQPDPKQQAALIEAAVADPWSNTALARLLDNYRTHASLGALTRHLLREANGGNHAANRLIVLARVLEAAGDRRRAAAALTRAIDAGDTSVQARDRLAALLTDQERLEEAQSVLLDAVSRSTDRHETAKFYRRLGLLASRQGDKAAARNYWQKIIRLELGAFDSYRRVADAMLDATDLDDAIALYREVASEAKDPQTAAQANYEIGKLYDDLSLPGQAVRAYRAAQENLPANHWLRRQLAPRLIRSEARVGKSQTLETLLKQLDAKPTDTALRLILIEAQTQRDRHDAALALTRAGLQLTPRDARLNDKYLALLQHGEDKVTYLAELQRHIGGGNASFALRLETARALLELGRAAEAGKTLAAAEPSGATVEDHLQAAALLESFGLAEPAQIHRKKAAEHQQKTAELELDRLRQAVKEQPDDAAMRDKLGLALWSAGDRDAALLHWVEAFHHTQGEEHNRLARAVSGRIAGLEQAEAEALIVRYNKDHEPNALTLLALARVYAAEAPRAILVLKDALRKDPTLVVGYQELAAASLRTKPKRVDDAVAALTRAAQIDPKSRLDLYAQIADLLTTESGKEAARPYWNRIEAEMPDNPFLLLRLADVHRARGEVDATLRFLERATNLPGVPDDVHIRLAATYAAAGQLPLALGEYETLLATATDEKARKRARYNLARAARKLYTQYDEQAARHQASGDAAGAQAARRRCVRPLTLMVRYAPTKVFRWMALLHRARMQQALGDRIAAAHAYAQTVQAGPPEPVRVRNELDVSAKAYARERLRDLIAHDAKLADTIKEIYDLTLPARAARPARDARAPIAKNPKIAWTATSEEAVPVFVATAGDTDVLVCDPEPRLLRGADGAAQEIRPAFRGRFRTLWPVAAAKELLILSTGSTLYGLRPDGVVRWRLDLPRRDRVEAAVQPRPVRVLYVRGLILAATAREVLAFDVDALEIRWRAAIDGGAATKKPTVTSLAANAGLCYVATTDGTVRAFDLQDGAAHWTARVPGVASLAAGENFLYALCNATGTVVALSPKNGAPKPATPLPLDPLAVAATGARGEQILIAEPGIAPRVFAYDATTDKIVWSLPLALGDGFRLLTRPVVVGDRIVIGTSRGEIVAIAEGE